MTFKEYPKIKTLGDSENEGIFSPGKVVVQSKVDGANFQFCVEDDGIHFGSHHHTLSDKDSHYNKWKAILPILKAYNENPEKFKKCQIYYGESMQQHTLHYNDDMPGFIGFDVYSLETHEFLDWKTAKHEFQLIGLPFIHVHFEADVNNISIQELHKLIPISPYREDGDEGIVIKRYDLKNTYGRPLFTKIVANDFKEKNRQKFVGIKNIYTDELNIVNTYCTNARIEKIIHKFTTDDQHKLSMSLIPILFREVTKDILEENIWEIYKEQKQIEFKTLEKLIANRCVKQLKIFMENKI